MVESFMLLLSSLAATGLSADAATTQTPYQPRPTTGSFSSANPQAAGNLPFGSSQVRISRYALEYLNSVFVRQLFLDQVRHATFKDRSFPEGGFVDAHLVGLDNVYSLMTLEDGYLYYMANLHNMTLEGNWLKDFSIFNLTGPVRVNFQHVLFSLQYNLTISDQGSPDIILTECKSDLVGFNAQFYGNVWSWFVDVFDKWLFVFSPMIERRGRLIMCDIITENIAFLRKKLSALSLKMAFDEPQLLGTPLGVPTMATMRDNTNPNANSTKFVFDCSLPQAPQIANDSNLIDAWLLGDVLWGTENSGLPRPPLVPIDQADKMFYISVSDFTLNSFTILAHNHQVFKLAIPVGPAILSFFGTSQCDLCQNITVQMETIFPPRIFFLSNQIKLLASVRFQINMTRFLAVRCEIFLEAFCSPYFKDDSFFWTSNITRFSVGLLSIIDPSTNTQTVLKLDTSFVEDLIMRIMHTVLDTIGQRGLALPGLLPGLVINGTQLDLHEHTLILGSNLFMSNEAVNQIKSSIPQTEKFEI